MTDPHYPSLAAILPCFNVETRCAGIIRSLQEYGCFIIAVNDGSLDHTGEILNTLGVTVITHDVNRGKGMALRSGLAYFLEQGNWDYAATVDADGQHDPHEIPAMMELLRREKIDLLIGSRQFELGKMPWKRWFANQVSSFFISLCLRTRIKDIQSGYRIYRREFVERILPQIQSVGFEIETELLCLALREKSAIRETPILSIYDERSTGLSQWRAFHDSMRIAKTILRFLSKP